MTSIGFSGVLKLTDLDDFISPGQECIKPIQGKPTVESIEPLSKLRIELEQDGTYIQTAENGNVKVLDKVSITLNDCLACSGCITSAESILISQQGPEELMKILNNHTNSKLSVNSKAEKYEHICIVTLGVQAVLSIAHGYSIDTQLAAEYIAGFFIESGADVVTMSTIGESMSLLESYYEFLREYESSRSLPILTGICPGWVCYGEKLHPQSLPFVSKVKSPQQIMGSLLKLVYGPQELSYTPDQITHVTLMSCFDRKLEASRSDFHIPEYKSRDVDHVITAIELDDYLSRIGKRILDYQPRKLINLFPEYSDCDLGSCVMSHPGSGSGGYAEFLFKSMSQHLFGKYPEEVIWKRGRNPDIWESVLCDESSDQAILKFGIATGFRNIQTIVRKLKSKVMTAQLPHYVEIMACPTGCLNGGAQLRGREVDALQGRDLAMKLESDYHKLPTVGFELAQLLQPIYNKIGSEETELYQKLFYTEFHPVEKLSGLIGSNMKW